MAAIFLIVKRVLAVFRPFWKTLAAISGLIMCQKIGDLLVPWFGGHVIDAMSQGKPLASVSTLVLTAFGFWVLHGNVLPYVLGRFDIRNFHYPARRQVSVTNIGTVLDNAGKCCGKDTALQQAVIERGEVVLVDFINSIVRVAIPTTIPGIVTLALLLWWFPMIGIIAIIGGMLDVLMTLGLNKALAPMFAKLQGFDFQRQRLHTEIFRNIAAIFCQGEEREKAAEYDARYSDYASFGIKTGVRYLQFNFGRGLIINVTNVCTWLVGAWYVHNGTYSLGLFLASLSWSSYVLGVLGAATDLHKQWLETMPAITAFFTEIDTLAAPQPAAGAELVPGHRAPTERVPAWIGEPATLPELT